MRWFELYIAVAWLLRCAMVPVILRRQLAPGASLAWLGIIFLHPYIGATLYLFLGETRLGPHRVQRHKEIVALFRHPASAPQLHPAITSPLAPSPGTPEETPGEGSAHHALNVTDPSPPRVAGVPPASPPDSSFTLQPSSLSPLYAPMILQAEKISGLPVLDGNHFDLLTTADAFTRRLAADIDAARSHVHLLYYLVARDATARTVTDALKRAAARGVTCRLLADAVASRPFFHRRHGLARDLRAAGVHVTPALPAHFVQRRLPRMDLRNHRKLAVVDDSVAYVGSHNLISPDYDGKDGGPWVDATARLTGPAVAELAAVFAEDWAFETEQLLPIPDPPPPSPLSRPACGAFSSLTPSPGTPGEGRGEGSAPPPLDPQGPPPPRATGDSPVSSSSFIPHPSSFPPTPIQVVPTGPAQAGATYRRVLLAAIQSARTQLTLTTPYFVPDEPTLVSLIMAADRGVAVTLILPETSDNPLTHAAGRAHYQRLLDAGVRIHLFRPGLLHTKSVTVDDAFAVFGSANLDVRSFNLNFELSLLLYGPDATARLHSLQSSYLADSTPLTPSTWSTRPPLRQYADSALSLLSPLL